MVKEIFAVLLAATFIVLLTGCDTSLRDNLQETQAEDIVALLRQEGVSAAKRRSEDGTWSVVLQNSQQADAEQMLHLYDLPRQRHPSIPDIFPGTGLLPSELEEHARYQYALGQELASTIERIDGVLSADVQIVLPRNDPKQIDPHKASASVFVRYRSDQRVDLMKSQIRTMVSHGIPGVAPDDVSVFTLPVYPIPRNPMTRLVDGWFGVRYVAADSLWINIWFVLPWLFVLGMAVLLLRAHEAPRHWRDRLGRMLITRFQRKRRGEAFGEDTKPSRPGKYSRGKNA